MALSEAGYGFLPVIEVDERLLATFQCGKPHLDEFLTQHAASMHRARLSYTSVVMHQDLADQVVGYFTLANDGLRLNSSEQFDLGLSEVPLSVFPAVKLCRLAVSQQLQGEGVGRSILDLVLGEVLEDDSLSAARLLVVDADNEDRVIRFYERYGFVPSLWAEQQNHNHGKRSRGQAQAPAAVKMLLDILDPET